MSYAQQRQIGTNRTLAIVVAAIAHVFLGYAVVTGLAYNVIQQANGELKTFNVLAEPPPPVDPSPPPPEPVLETPTPPVVSPPPIVRVKVAPPVVQTVQDAPPPVVTPRASPAPPAPPAPPPAVLPAPPIETSAPVQTVPPRSATGDLQGLFRGDDYPLSAILADEQGSVTVRLTVGEGGQVSNCKVASSSGSQALDRATCQILKNRARFAPARDNRGNPTTDTVSQRISWVLEG